MRLVRRYAEDRITGELWQADAVRFLESLAPESAALAFLDPPFNLNKQYSASHPDMDNRPENEYSGWLKEVVRQTARVLKPGGALYLYHLPLWALRIGAFLDGSLTFRHWIAVSMKNGFVRGPRLYPAHYALLFFTKGPPATFSRPRLKPQTCRTCGAYIKDYGGYRAIIEEKGINLSDVWDDISPLRHAPLKNREGNELPPVIFDRIFAISGSPGELYIDPFAGSGTGLIAALTHRMRFAACDLLAKNCRAVIKRLRSLSSEALKP